MKKCFLPLIVIFLSSFLFAQKRDLRLQKKVESLLSEFPDPAGVYVKCLRNGNVVAINADTIFPTASMIKIPILTGILDKLNKNELQYHQELVYKDSLHYAGVDILGSFKQDEKIELSKLIMLMLTMSDNTASLWLQSLAGGGSRINQILDSAGFIHTRVNTRTIGREENRNVYGWGQTTPKEMVLLMEKIYLGEIISKDASSMMLRLLGRNYWDEIANSQIPPEIFVASKGGAVNESRSETLLVMAPNGPYIFCVATKNLQDQSWDPGNKGWVLARKLSRLLWNYFEPGYDWKPYLSVDGK
jgi:beta-lactamase class A